MEQITVTFDSQQEIIPTINFEYDSTWTGGESSGEAGNYEGSAGGIVQIPVSLIAETDEKTAFEQFTGLNRCHIVHWDCEESEAWGDEKTQEQIEHLRKRFEIHIEQHRRVCVVCSGLTMNNRYNGDNIIPNKRYTVKITLRDQTRTIDDVVAPRPNLAVSRSMYRIGLSQVEKAVAIDRNGEQIIYYNARIRSANALYYDERDPPLG